jgi:hypothetical protein
MHITVLIAPDGSEGGGWVIMSGTGELAGLRGEGRWWAHESWGSEDSYSGVIH